MVVGAGALGNEVLKNLSLLGIGGVIIVDFDTIENSNLSRSVLFRQSAERASKAQTAAAAVRDINPDVKTHPLDADIATDVGLGLFLAADVVIGCLDSREARLSVNRSCWHVGRTWIDGGLGVFEGEVRIFSPPESACYECTLSAEDYQWINIRYSCPLLKREDMLKGHIPTTPTTASIIAAIQVQEAVRFLHHLDVPAGKGIVYNGNTHELYLTAFTRRDDCLSHDPYPSITPTGLSARTATVGDVLRRAEEEIGAGATIELDRNIVKSLRCPACQTDDVIFRPLGRVTESSGICPRCGNARQPGLLYRIAHGDGLEDKTISEIGLPIYHIITVRSGDACCHLLLDGDADEALGELASVGAAGA
jgi:adenylyltransferase/sulfurtransferase